MSRKNYTERKKRQEIYTLHRLRSDSLIIPPRPHKRKKKTPILTSCSFLCVADVDPTDLTTELCLSHCQRVSLQVGPSETVPQSVCYGLDNQSHPALCSQCLAEYLGTSYRRLPHSSDNFWCTRAYTRDSQARRVFRHLM